MNTKRTSNNDIDTNDIRQKNDLSPKLLFLISKSPISYLTVSFKRLTTRGSLTATVTGLNI